MLLERGERGESDHFYESGLSGADRPQNRKEQDRKSFSTVTIKTMTSPLLPST